VRCVDRTTARHRPDQLEVGEGEQHENVITTAMIGVSSG
jgi:hypothetical protein